MQPKKAVTFADHGLDTDDEVSELVDSAAANADPETEEAEFVERMAEKINQYGCNAYCSEKQLAWLRRIAGDTE